MAQSDLDLDALARADKVTVHVSHDNHHVDDREPLEGRPVEVNSRGELAVQAGSFAFFVKAYDHDDETFLATKARSTTTRPRDRATTFTVEGVEAQWSL